jgi:hypothetical protein
MNVIAERAPCPGSSRPASARRRALEDAVTILHTEPPDFPAPPRTATRTLFLGTLSGLSVARLQGRKHVYEGGDPGAMRGPSAAQGGGAEALSSPTRSTTTPMSVPAR